NDIPRPGVIRVQGPRSHAPLHHVGCTRASVIHGQRGCRARGFDRMRAILLIGLASLILVVPAAVADETVSALSYNAGKCSSTTNGYKYNNVTATGWVLTKFVTVQAGNVCDTQHTSTYNYDY